MPRKKKTAKTTSNALPLISGVVLPKMEKEYVEDMPINKIHELEGEGDLRRYDEQSNKALAESLKKFGFLEPIIVDEDGGIIHGVHRYRIARDVLSQISVPVVIVKNWTEKHTPAQTRFYNAYANKINDWSNWIAENMDEMLRRLDGGVKQELILGDEGTFVTAPDESGEYRDMGRILGMFIDVIPEQLCANTATLQFLAELRTKSLGMRYQYNDEQLLFVETLRKQINHYRKTVVDHQVGEDTGNLAIKYDYEEKWDKGLLDDGRKVARITFLHSVGLPDAQISKIVGVPLDNKTQLAQARKEGLSNVAEMVTVENALRRSKRRPFNVRDTYCWWINTLFTTRAEVLQDAELRGILDELKKLRVPSNITAKGDGPMPPTTKLSLRSKKARELRDKAVDRILELTKDLKDSSQGNPAVTRGMAEDWVDWPEALNFYAGECFQNVIDEINASKPKYEKGKTPFDVKATRQPSNKLCNKGEFKEMVWLDRQQKNFSAKGGIPALEGAGKLVLDGLSDDDVATIKDEIDGIATDWYDGVTPQILNKFLVDMRGLYNQGPINLFSMMGPNRDGDLSGDPDAKRMELSKREAEESKSEATDGKTTSTGKTKTRKSKKSNAGASKSTGDPAGVTIDATSQGGE